MPQRKALPKEVDGLWYSIETLGAPYGHKAVAPAPRLIVHRFSGRISVRPFEVHERPP